MTPVRVQSSGPPPFPRAPAGAVELAAIESFPASDPTGLAGVSTGRPDAGRRAPVSKPAKERDRSDRKPERSSAGTEPAGGAEVIPFPRARTRRGPAGSPMRHPDATARIYSPSPSVMQSGRGSSGKWVIEFEPKDPPRVEPLMGWTSSRDVLQSVRLAFPDEERAVAFAERQGWPYLVREPRWRRARPRSVGREAAPALCGVPADPLWCAQSSWGAY